MGTIFDTPPIRKSPLHEAAKARDVEQVRALITANPDLVFSKDRYGRTVLHYAATFGADLLRMLLGNKAEVNARCDRGYTPLHIAAANGNNEGVELLLANGAEIEAKANDGATALQEAESNKYPDLARFLRGREAGGTKC